MPKSLPVADAVAALINAENLAPPGASCDFAEVAIAPTLSRIDAGQMRCYVEPVGRAVNDTEFQDACSDEWSAEVVLVFVQRFDDPGSAAQLPGSMDQTRRAIAVAESVAEMLMNKTKLTTVNGVAILDKPSVEHTLVNREWLHSGVFYSEMRLRYG